VKQLQDPFVVPKDPRLWCPALEKAKPERLFMILVDHSKDAKGEPGPDVSDGVLYVITELAQYSLKDFLGTKKHDHEGPLSKETVRSMTKALVMVMAGLHAKGFVHLDLKPENLMVFDGCLKLIDVDGCVTVGMSIAISNPSISFSPCYCAPEWANFLLAETEANIVADPCLDVWSTGCTICEFVTLDAILKPTYANFLRHAHSHREAGFLFMDWLSNIKKSPVPMKTVGAFDSELTTLLKDSLLVPDRNLRKTCAEALSNPYLTKAKLRHTQTNPLSVTGDESETPESFPVGTTTESFRKVREKRAEDHSTEAAHRGTLWKLNSGQDGTDPANWLQRDMWISNNGSLCYFSQRDDKKLVLVDSHKLHQAEIKRATGLAKENAFQVKCGFQDGDTTEGDDSIIFTFAAASLEELKEWGKQLKSAASMDVMPTHHLGEGFRSDLAVFKLLVKNRRMKVEGGYEHDFEPVYKGNLWKVKGAGDIGKDEDWFLRQMWLSRNGSLVYWSVRDNRELVYYTSTDIHRAEVAKTPSTTTSAKPFGFQVTLPSHEGMEYQQGEFAAESEEARDAWLSEFWKFQL